MPRFSSLGSIRFFLFATLLFAAAAVVRAAELTVLAASSLSDVLRETAPAFTAETGHTLRFHFGASGLLARQIREGAPADLFFSADDLRTDQLQAAGLLLADTRRPLLSNTLVVVTARTLDVGAVTRLSDLTHSSIRRIAIGEPAIVPAGSYARAHLEKISLWASLAEKCLPVESVRAALAAVESGNADAAFVYRTDALSSSGVRIAIEIPADPAHPIVYPAAIVADSRHPAAARAYLAWLAAPTAQAVFARYGFLPPPLAN